jgi:hypothetical protein
MWSLKKPALLRQFAYRNEYETKDFFSFNNKKGLALRVQEDEEYTVL